METLTVALSEDMFTILRDPCVSVRGLVAAEGLIRSPVCKTRIAEPLASIVKIRDIRLTGFVRPAAIPVLPIPMVILVRPDCKRQIPPGCGSLPSSRLLEAVTSRSPVEMVALQGCEPLTAPSSRLCKGVRDLIVRVVVAVVTHPNETGIPAGRPVGGCCRAHARRTSSGNSLGSPRRSGQP